MLVTYFAIVLGLVLLTYGADRFVAGATAVAHDLGVSNLVIGLTVVAFATSAPEMLVSTDAALNKASQIAIGNAIGSNIANIGLVVGVTALLVPLKVASGILRREYPLMFVALFIPLPLMLDGELGRMDGVIMALALVAVVWATVWLSQRSAHVDLKVDPKADPYVERLSDEIPTSMPLTKAFLWFLAGLVIMLIGSRLLVWGAIKIAEGFGVSELVIGLTIVAVGTSLPELAASVTSALKGNADLAVGNILGSNIFNMLGVLCLPGLIHPSGFSADVLQRDFPIMLGLSVALFVMSFGYRGTGTINRYFGAVLLLIFCGYQGMLYTYVGAG